MTLHEYLNQDEPKRKPHVFLKPAEVVVYRVSGGEFQCQIPAVAAKYNIDATYIIDIEDRRLHVVNKDGSRGNASCFALNFDPTKLTSESTFQPLK